MKRTDAITKIVSLLLFGALLAYVGVYLFRSMTNDLRTAPAVYVSLTETGTASGTLVREESLLSSKEQYLSVTAEDGYLVAAGDIIALAYTDEAARNRAVEIHELDLRRQRIVASLEGASSAEDLPQRDSSIKSAIFDLSTSAVQHRTEDISSASIKLSTLVMTSEEAGATEEDLLAVNEKLSQLRQNAMRDTIAIVAPSPGLFSTARDGFEHLGPKDLKGLTPTKLRELTKTPETLSEDVRGKLASSYEWYFAALMSQKDAARLKTGGSAKLNFGRYCGRLLSADVRSISAPENGECAVVFRCTQAQAEMLAPRNVTAEVIFDTREGIRVPKKAVYTDENGSYVFTMTGMQAEKKYISTVWETEEYYLAEQASDAAALRVGNEIILT
ncbi:MAG: HlyD family efflux transporter periplasmic adaptor subunit, partial [Oscillospiraceae bacterium]